MRSDEEVEARLDLALKQERESRPFTVPMEEASYWVSACRWFLGDDSIKLTTEEEPEELRLGERMIEIPLGRRFPERTHGDWVNLGISIKEKDPSPGTVLEVNHALNTILEEEQGEAEEDAGYTAGDAKWWLVEKATELGVI